MSVDLDRLRALRRMLARRFEPSGDSPARAGPTCAAADVLRAIGRERTPVRLLRERLALGSAQLGRLLRMLEHEGLVRPGARGQGDSRRAVALTRAGLARLQRVDAQDEAQLRALLAPLTAEEARRLGAAMTEIERILTRSAVTIEPADPDGEAARWCFARYFDELDARFPGGFDRSAGGGTVRAELMPPRGRLLIARLDGAPVGCAAIRALSPGILEIKRMWVAPSARGFGIGRDLLEALERIARRRRVRLIRLDTHATLTEALRLYRRAGYRRIPRYNDNPYAQRWFEKSLRAAD